MRVVLIGDAHPTATGAGRGSRQPVDGLHVIVLRGMRRLSYACEGESIAAMVKSE